MAKLVWKSARLFCAGADLTTVNNQIEAKAEVEAQDATAFTTDGSLWTEILPGLRMTEITAGGQWEAGDLGKVDNVAFGDLGSLTPWTVAPDGASAGSLAYLTSALRTSYELGGAVGDVAPWTADGKGSWPLVRGVVAHPPGTARTTSGFGPAVELGAVTSGQHFYASLHVLSVSGTSTPTLTVTIESSEDDQFNSPIDRLTFSSATAISGQASRTAGAITDEWWQPKWTITGTSPSFLFVVSMGIA